MRKKFDCVEMKNRIQEKMLEDDRRFGVEEMKRRRREWRETSDDELAKLWRRLAARDHPAEFASTAVREDEAECGGAK